MVILILYGRGFSKLKSYDYYYSRMLVILHDDIIALTIIYNIYFILPIIVSW